MDMKVLVQALSDEELAMLGNVIFAERQARAQHKIATMPPLDDGELNCLRFNQKVAAIKRYRERTGCNIMLAKAVVDHYEKAEEMA